MAQQTLNGILDGIIKGYKKINTMFTELYNEIGNKVSIEAGKGLSTNDYTTTEKNKLNGIEAGAQANAVISVNGETGAVTVEGMTAQQVIDLAFVTPLTGQTFAGEFDLTISEKTFVEYSTNTALTPTLKAGTNKVGAVNIVDINAGALASLSITNIGQPWPQGSATFTPSKINKLIVFVEEANTANPTGIYHKIILMN